MSAKQRVVFAALRDVPLDRGGKAVGAATIAAVCPAPWHKRTDLVTQELVLLKRDGMVLAAAGSTGAWKITAAGSCSRRAAARRASGAPSAADPHAR